LPTTVQLILFADPRIAPDEILRYFSWPVFAIIVAVYTVVVFLAELAKDGPFIFSRNNARTKSQILYAHGMFLVILLCGYRICPYIVRTLPFWMTDTFVRHGSRTSFADLVFCLAGSGLALLERKWLYRSLAGTGPVSMTNTGEEKL
jgi:hypothetical protein